MYDNEEGHRDRNNRRASTFDTPTCEGVDNTVAASLGKSRRPRKDEYKTHSASSQGRVGVLARTNTNTIGFLARKGRASQRRKHGLLARGGKRALSTHKQLPRKEGIGCHNAANTKTRAPHKERQTGAKRSRNNGSTGYAVNRQDRGP
ncbi:hypothetical protein DFJ43DRAFT_1141700 [Lentinula guzmanii]|uniref:Uncharacterized protein n=1 Tax=Lentinula guzmanii TaxID=2804957 RepID=A0AA38MWT9_9AGAR|nr:hypothetical protein DFJ43DRAFT_1141700 [Lentinula guzmanii]